MIELELELKYKLQNLPPKIKDYEIIYEKSQKDIYYDTNNYDLIKAGNFLRIRNDKKLDFKLNVGDASHLYCNETSFNINEFNNNSQYINEILKMLNLNQVENLENLEQLITSNKFKILSPIIKHRTAFKFSKNCTLYIDEVEDLGMFMEAEIMIDADKLLPEKADEIKKQLIQDLKKAQILTGTEEQVKIGYVELYLLKHNIEAYNLGLYKI